MSSDTTSQGSGPQEDARVESPTTDSAPIESASREATGEEQATE